MAEKRIDCRLRTSSDCEIVVEEFTTFTVKRREKQRASVKQSGTGRAGDKRVTTTDPNERAGRTEGNAPKPIPNDITNNERDPEDATETLAKGGPSENMRTNTRRGTKGDTVQSRVASTRVQDSGNRKVSFAEQEPKTRGQGEQGTQGSERSGEGGPVDEVPQVQVQERLPVETGAYSDVPGESSNIEDSSDVVEGTTADNEYSEDSGGPLASRFPETESEEAELLGKRERDSGDDTDSSDDDEKVIGETRAIIQEMMEKLPRLKQLCRKTSKANQAAAFASEESENLEPVAYCRFMWDHRIVCSLGAVLKEHEDGTFHIPEGITTILGERQYMMKEAIRRSKVTDYTMSPDGAHTTKE